MNLLRKPIIATPATIHSAFTAPKQRVSSSRSAAVSVHGIWARDRATATVASSPGVYGAVPPRSACAIFSTGAPRRNAKEQECAVQYGQPAVRLATYMP